MAVELSDNAVLKAAGKWSFYLLCAGNVVNSAADSNSKVFKPPSFLDYAGKNVNSNCIIKCINTETYDHIYNWFCSLNKLQALGCWKAEHCQF